MKGKVLKEVQPLDGVVISPQIAIYARCGHGGSVDNQIEACKQAVSDNSSVSVYSDIDASGMDLHRSALNALIDDVKNGLVDKVVITDISRISRSISDFFSLYNVLVENNVALCTVDNTFGNNTLLDNCIVKMMQCLEEYRSILGGGRNGKKGRN